MLLESVVSAKTIRGNSLFDVTFLKDFGPWHHEQKIAQLVRQGDHLIELDDHGDEIQSVQVMLMPVPKQIRVNGRHRAERRGQPEFVATYNNGVVRVDDNNHPDFWLEVCLG